MKTLVHRIPHHSKDVFKYTDKFLSQFGKANQIESASIGGVPGIPGEVILEITYIPLDM